MHEEEVEIDESVVRRLVDEQLPQYADLALERIDTWGTDHVIFRLGEELSIRLPKIAWAAKQGDKEARWLPHLAPHLPIEVPIPLAVCEPAHGYPFRWYVAPWLAGHNPPADQNVDLVQLACDVAQFVLALQRVDTEGAVMPAPGQRGGPLLPADERTRHRADQMRGDADVDGLMAIWEAGLAAPDFDGAPVWVHGDISDGNLLMRDARLSGAIDWGGLIAGDPAVDLIIAWSYFDPDSRAVYREALGFVDDAMWMRARAWAVSQAVNAIPYYRDTNHDIVARSWRAVEAALSEWREN